MAWKVTSQMSVREEFAALATVEGAHVRELCRRFGVSPKTGYKWISRYRELGLEGLADQSRRPRSSPGSTAAEMVALIAELRRKHPAWGGRKLKRRLEDLQHTEVPAASTITAILRREGLMTGPGAGVSQGGTGWLALEPTCVPWHKRYDIMRHSMTEPPLAPPPR